MDSPVACTIVANNYLAYARAFTRSFLARHPDGRVGVLIVDRPEPGHRYEDEPFDVTFAEELGIPAFPHLSFRYSILELSTAVKPWYLLHLHRKLGCDRLCYFDPDILVFGDLGELYDRLGRADCVLTPHLTAPIEDQAVPSEREILLSGIYNLGFLGLAFNERTLPFLDWWCRRLYHWCLHEVEHGLFVDQRWMDFAPAFLPGADVLRDPGYNVAYWNLAHRTVSRTDGEWRVNGVPLRFFHFSGFDHRRPELISRFQNRFTFRDRPDVQPLFAIYAEAVRSQGQEEVSAFPYRFGRFDNGVPIPEVARRALRQADPEGRRWPDPFAAGGEDSFFSWLRRPPERRADVSLPRLALLLWDHRDDLQRFFPEPGGKDRVRFAGWFAASTGAPENIHPEFVGEVERDLRGYGHAESEAGRARSASTQRKLEDLASLVAPAPVEPLSRDEVDWLTADAGYEPVRRPRVPRLALEMHRRRPDLQRAYPDPLGADRGPLALWYATYGRLEYQLPDAVVHPVRRTLSLRQQAWARLWWERHSRRLRAERQRAAAAAALAPAAGDFRRPADGPVPKAEGEGVNVIGWVTAPTGVGEACRGSLAALAQAGVPTAVWPLDGRADGAPGAVAHGAGQGLPYEVSLYHVNADMMETVQARLPRALAAGRHRIGYWFWELSHFPLGFAHAFRHVDEVWAPTRFCEEAFRPLSPVPVHWVPPCVVPPRAEPASRAELGVPERAFLYFFAFDALSVPERKNPEGLIAAFARAARECRRPVHLLLKANHTEAVPDFAERLQRLCSGLPVTLLTGTLRRDELDGLTAACDAYVSLHRSEGLGLPLIEAMYLGKPVVATGYGGVTDFLDDETGFVVRHRTAALERAHGPYPAGAVWAEPDLEHAASLLRGLAEAPESAAPRVAAARRRVRELYAPAAAAERFRRELARIVEAQQVALHV